MGEAQVGLNHNGDWNLSANSAVQFKLTRTCERPSDLALSSSFKRLFFSWITNLFVTFTLTFYPLSRALVSCRHTRAHTNSQIVNAISIKLPLYYVRTAIMSEATLLWTSVVRSEKALKRVHQHIEKLYRGLSSVCATLALYIKLVSFWDLGDWITSENCLKKL